MPIPTDGAWPPPAYQPAYDAYRDWDAWYAGDPDRLRKVYAGRTTSATILRPGQTAGGLLGMVSRWLWGAPAPVGQRDGRLHVPLPADLAATSANLLFSEPPKLDHEDAGVMERLEQLVEDGFATMLLHAAEADSALGDVYLRPVIDTDVLPDRAFLTAVHADGALPLIRWGRLVEVTFWSELLVDGDTHIRLLEHHDVVNGAGRIVYALHEGTKDRLGRAVPLTDHASAAYLAELVDEDGAQATGLNRLDVVRVPNAGPQRLWRASPGLKYFGRSDFDGNEQWFDALDDTWTSWLRDVRLARTRILAPEYMLESLGAGNGAVFDADREVFTALRMAPNKQGPDQGITLNQFLIRHEQHKATADAIVETALRHAGLSSQTLGEEGDVAVTATEVQARERQSFTTRGNRIQTWRPALADAIELLLELEYAKRQQLGGSRPEPVKVNVEFGDSVSESPETMARTLQLLHAAEAVSIETRVRWVHPDWDDIQVREEVARIKGDAPPTVEVGGALGALAGNSPPPTDDAGQDAEEPPAEE
ncbi:A118 family predicted phage portal protein [Micromonospora sp. M71_S20]|uniref:phage capsid protein n=1 Tax=Micromonospora sp. M71_S20 TaxID=592872 RepID=UPI000EAF870C|nr:phage capsid protein [Micromonospora sp. M71_S20]RLK13316.1 A118 family predicted phage portal protein [Micromonospora sp. M71_S20]